MNARLYSTVCLLAGVLLAGCDAPRDAGTYDAGPRGYVAFYIPADDPAYGELRVGAQIYRIEGGKRIFAGSTQKWRNLQPARHGLTLALPPGDYAFSVEMAGGAAPVTLRVERDHYHPVRIGATGLIRSQMIGMSDRIQFRIRVTPETPIQPAAAPR